MDAKSKRASLTGDVGQNETMSSLTKNDIETLRNSRGVTFRVVVPVLFFGMSAFHLVWCLFGLYLTDRIALAGGFTIGDVWLQWLEGVEFSTSYPGVLIRALDRLSMSLLQLGLIFFFFAMGCAAVIHNRRNRRFADFMEETEGKEK